MNGISHETANAVRSAVEVFSRSMAAAGHTRPCAVVLPRELYEALAASEGAGVRYDTDSGEMVKQIYEHVGLLWVCAPLPVYMVIDVEGAPPVRVYEGEPHRGRKQARS